MLRLLCGTSDHELVELIPAQRSRSLDNICVQDARLSANARQQRMGASELTQATPKNVQCRSSSPSIHGITMIVPVYMNGYIHCPFSGNHMKHWKMQ